MSDEQKTILVFNASLQKETEHSIDIDGNGEIVLTCIENGRFIKFPAGTTAEQLKELLAAHKESNHGQVTQEALDAQKEELISKLAS